VGGRFFALCAPPSTLVMIRQPLVATGPSLCYGWRGKPGGDALAGPGTDRSAAGEDARSTNLAKFPGRRRPRN